LLEGIEEGFKSTKSGLLQNENFAAGRLTFFITL